jgi:hypothetical protein
MLAVLHRYGLTADVVGDCYESKMLRHSRMHGALLYVAMVGISVLAFAAATWFYQVDPAF